MIQKISVGNVIVLTAPITLERKVQQIDSTIIINTTIFKMDGEFSLAKEQICSEDEQ